MMTGVAFDANGEPFGLPATAAFWRVRRFRNVGARGAREVVFGRDGLPLVLPIDTELAEFRRMWRASLAGTGLVLQGARDRTSDHRRTGKLRCTYVVNQEGLIKRPDKSRASLFRGRLDRGADPAFASHRS